MIRWLGLFLVTGSCFGQNDVSHSGAWFMYFGDHLWNEHWGFHAEAQLRRVDGVLHGNQLFLRPGIEYKLNEHFTFTLAYANVQNYSFDSLSFPTRINEHRIDEEATISHPLGKLKLAERFRLEQRFGNYAGDWQFRNRPRIRVEAELPLTRQYYLAAYNEVFVNFGAHSLRAFDQNWVYGAIGRDFGKRGKVEIGYLNQYQQLTDVRFRHIHNFQLSYFSKAHFGKQR